MANSKRPDGAISKSAKKRLDALKEGYPLAARVASKGEVEGNIRSGANQPPKKKKRN